jgi:PHD/YefM family antitoxin component YafN of YafNO toxin-antitoxin module
MRASPVPNDWRVASCSGEAETQDVVITRHGKPAGVLIGFKSEDDWFDYRLERDPRFLQRAEQARASFRVGRGVKLEDVK